MGTKRNHLIKSVRHLLGALWKLLLLGLYLLARTTELLARLITKITDKLLNLKS